MGLELIPILVFAWFIELTQLIQSNAGLLFFTSLLAIFWAAGIIAVMRRWESR